MQITHSLVSDGGMIFRGEARRDNKPLLPPAILELLTEEVSTSVPSTPFSLIITEISGYFLDNGLRTEEIVRGNLCT